MCLGFLPLHLFIWQLSHSMQTNNDYMDKIHTLEGNTTNHLTTSNTASATVCKSVSEGIPHECISQNHTARGYEAKNKKKKPHTLIT